MPLFIRNMTVYSTFSQAGVYIPPKLAEPGKGRQISPRKNWEISAFKIVKIRKKSRKKDKGGVKRGKKVEEGKRWGTRGKTGERKDNLK